MMMYFSASFLTLFLTIDAVGANVRGARNLSQVPTSTTTVPPTLLETNDGSTTEEVCYQGFANAAEEQLVELLIHGLLGTSTSDEASKSSTLPTVSHAVPGVPDYVVGCSIFNWKCLECSLCEDVYGALVETGSKAACDAGCILLVETIGGGPLDPIADIVEKACIPLCAAIFDKALPSAHAACAAVNLCSN